MRKQRHYRVLDNALKPLKVVVLGALVFGVSACATLPSKLDKVKKEAEANGSAYLDEAADNLLKGSKVLVVNATPIREALSKFRWDNHIPEGKISEKSLPKDLVEKAHKIVFEEIKKQEVIPEKDLRLEALGHVNPFSNSFDFALPVPSEKRAAVIFLDKGITELYSWHGVFGLDEALGPSFLGDYQKIVKAHEYFHAWQAIEKQNYFFSKGSQGDKGGLALETDADHWAVYNAALAGINQKSLEVWTDLRAWDFLRGHYTVDHATSPRLNDILSTIYPDQSARGEDPITKIQKDDLVDISARFHKILDRELKNKFGEEGEYGTLKLGSVEGEDLGTIFTKDFYIKLQKMEVIADCLDKGLFDKQEAVLGRHVLTSGKRLLKIVKNHAEGLEPEKDIRARGFFESERSSYAEAGKVVEALNAFEKRLETYNINAEASEKQAAPEITKDSAKAKYSSSSALKKDGFACG